MAIKTVTLTLPCMTAVLIKHSLVKQIDEIEKQLADVREKDKVVTRLQPLTVEQELAFSKAEDQLETGVFYLKAGLDALERATKNLTVADC